MKLSRVEEFNMIKKPVANIYMAKLPEKDKKLFPNPQVLYQQQI